MVKREKYLATPRDFSRARTNLENAWIVVEISALNEQ
jgi:hypothetical protein